MTRELITRGPFNPGGMTARWMLESGAGPFPGAIQLTLPTKGGESVWTRLDLGEAGDLYQALEAHMENLAADGARPLTDQERERLLRKHQEGVRIRNAQAIREEIDRPLKLVREDPRSYGGKPDQDEDVILDENGDDPRSYGGKPIRDGLPVKTLNDLMDAVEELVDVWTSADPTAHNAGWIQDSLRGRWPVLGAALDRLANLRP